MQSRKVSRYRDPEEALLVSTQAQEESRVCYLEGLDETQVWKARRPSGTQDRQDMQRMGKKQELERNFRDLSAIAFTSCVTGTWEATIGQAFVVLSLAEMSSMAPTAGGQFHWISEFAHPHWQRHLSYCSGWLSLIAWQGIFAADCYMIAGIVQALIGMHNPAYAPTRWQATLFTIASATTISIFNAFVATHLSIAEGIFAVCHVFAFVPIVVTLWVLGPKNPAKEVFFTFTDNGGGWPSVTFSVLIGQLSSAFTVLGSDCVAHIAEEVQGASLIVPRCMVWSYFLNIPMTFIMLVTYLFNVNSIPDALDVPYPFVQVLQSTIQSSAAAFAFTIVVLILLCMVTISTMASTSRQTFAFSREQGLPYSGWISKVDPRYKVPVNAIILTACLTTAVSFIYIGSTVAFNALLSLAIVSLNSTYALAIGCITLKRLRREPLPPARWTLGRAGPLVNCLGLLYSSWAFFWSFMPSYYHVTAGNFPWGGLLFVCLVAFALLLYRVGGKSYEGPVVCVLRSEEEL